MYVFNNSVNSNSLACQIWMGSFTFLPFQACCTLQLLKYVNKLLEKDEVVAAELAELFVGELNPVAPKAQKKVPVPDG